METPVAKNYMMMLIGAGFGFVRSFGTHHPRAIVAAWTLALSIIALGPLFVFAYPGLQDYPNHLARGFILLNPDDPILQQLYSVQWATLPNLGWDIWVMIIGRFLPLEWAGKLFLFISGASILAGCFALNRALASKCTFAPLLAVPFLFSSALTRGFLNFELGVGCALLAAAWWVFARDRHWLQRLVLATIWSTSLYLIHLYAWAFYGLFVVAFELQRLIEKKEPRPALFFAHLARDGLQAAPALAMFIYANATSTRPELLIQNFDFPHKRLGHIENLINVGDPILNGVLVVIVATLIAMAILRFGWIRIKSDCALLIGLATGLFFALPDQVAGTAQVAWRVAFMTALVTIASCVPTEKGNFRINPILSVIAVVTVIAATANIKSWRDSETGRQAFFNLTQNIPEGSALFFVHNHIRPRDVVGLFHVASFAVITKRALVGSMFTLPGQQPLRFRDQDLQSSPYNTSTFLIDIKKRYEKAGLDFSSHLLRFDYIVVHGADRGDDLEQLSLEGLVLVEQTGNFRMYKVNAVRSLGVGDRTQLRYPESTPHA